MSTSTWPCIFKYCISKMVLKNCFFSAWRIFFPMKITNWLFLCWIDALIVTYVSTHQEWRNDNAWECWHFENISINIFFRSHTYMLICSGKKSNLLILKRNHDSFFYVYTLSMKKEQDFGVSFGTTSFNSLMVFIQLKEKVQIFRPRVKSLWINWWNNFLNWWGALTYY